jgi:hypothetical protein
VVGKDTHLTGGGGDVDLGPVVAKVRQYSGSVGVARKKGGNEHASGAVDSLRRREMLVRET